MNTPSNLVSPDDKTVPTMIYSHQKIIWGNLISRQSISVSTWLKTEMAPNFLTLVNAQIFLFGAGEEFKKFTFPILHIHKEQIIAYHILPPADESPYYDENTPNRIMEPVTIVAGFFLFEGQLRFSEETDLLSYLNGHSEDFVSVFNFSMTCPLIPSLKSLRVPFGMINQNLAMVSKRKSNVDEQE